MKYKHTKESLEKVIKESLSLSEVCRKLGIIAAGGNYKTLRNKITEYNIDISHFTGQGWNTGKKYRKVITPIPLDDILIQGSVYKSNKLKIRLFESGLKIQTCECCGLSEWMGNKINLELHHMNGDSNDNRLENLQILCPNCHSMTDNYRGKNVKRKKTEPSSIWLDVIEQSKNLELPKKIKHCKSCGNEYSGNSKKYCSIECYYDGKRVNKTIPKVPELLESFEKYKTFTSVGRYYNVSDNAVRKWCENYGIMEIIKNSKKVLSI